MSRQSLALGRMLVPRFSSCWSSSSLLLRRVPSLAKSVANSSNNPQQQRACFSSSTASSKPACPYRLLSLSPSPTITDAEVKTAYYKMARIHHPDAHVDTEKKADASAMFVKLTDAYEKIRDADRRRMHSMGIDANEVDMDAMHNSGGPSASGFRWANFHPGTNGGKHPHDYFYSVEDEEDLGEFRFFDMSDEPSSGFSFHMFDTSGGPKKTKQPRGGGGGGGGGMRGMNMEMHDFFDLFKLLNHVQGGGRGGGGGKKKKKKTATPHMNTNGGVGGNNGGYASSVNSNNQARQNYHGQQQQPQQPFKQKKTSNHQDFSDFFGHSPGGKKKQSNKPWGKKGY